MDTVSVKEVRRNLSHFIEAARRGTPVTITRRGRKVARLVGVHDGTGKGLPGSDGVPSFAGESTKTPNDDH